MPIELAYCAAILALYNTIIHCTSNSCVAFVGATSVLHCRGLAAKYHMPMELAYSLATLALYDIIIYCDDSGSMAFEENGERINDLKLMVGRVADVATLFDEDGILVRFMNGTLEGNGIRDSASAGQLISQVSVL